MKSGHLDRNDPVFIEGNKAMATIEEMENALEALNSALENPTVAALSKAIATGQFDLNALKINSKPE